MTGSRIQRRLFAVLVTLVAAVVVFAAIFQGSRVGSDVRANLQASLIRQARMLAAELERSPPSSLSDWAHRVPADVRVRNSRRVQGTSGSYSSWRTRRGNARDTRTIRPGMSQSNFLPGTSTSFLAG